MNGAADHFVASDAEACAPMDEAGPNTLPRCGPGARTVLAALRLYRSAVSPLRPPACRFTPSCSAYAVQAIEIHGLARGSWLALRRLSRCHPFHRGGHDPVPARVHRQDPVPTSPARHAA